MQKTGQKHKRPFSIYILIALLFTTYVKTTAQKSQTGQWNNKQCAVVLTYDDGTDFHLDNVIPVLDSAGLKATFYIPGNSPSLYKRMDEWRAAAREGHELGNHTLFHPCHGKSKNQKWVKPEYDLDTYTVLRYLDEIKVNNTLLKAIDGKTERTFAYTCGDVIIDGTNVVDLMKDYFVAARGTERGVNCLKDADLYNIKIYSVKNQTAEEVIKVFEKEEQKKCMICFLFHGIGGGSPFSMSTEEHSKLIHYFEQHEDKIWIAPLIDVAKYIEDHR